jgi:hypothetical protein
MWVYVFEIGIALSKISAQAQNTCLVGESFLCVSVSVFVNGSNGVLISHFIDEM